MMAAETEFLANTRNRIPASVTFRGRRFHKAEHADLTIPEMNAAAGFHRHDAGRELAKKLQQLSPPQTA
jgi:hypothetical protein